MDPEKRRALTSFYREEFLRYLDHFEAIGLLSDRRSMHRKLISELEEVCCRDRFPAVAETLLRSLETLARLSPPDPRRSH